MGVGKKGKKLIVILVAACWQIRDDGCVCVRVGACLCAPSHTCICVCLSEVTCERFLIWEDWLWPLWRWRCVGLKPISDATAAAVWTPVPAAQAVTARRITAQRCHSTFYSLATLLCVCVCLCGVRLKRYISLPTYLADIGFLIKVGSGHIFTCHHPGFRWRFWVLSEAFPLHQDPYSFWIVSGMIAKL